MLILSLYTAEAMTLSSLPSKLSFVPQRRKLPIPLKLLTGETQRILPAWSVLRSFRPAEMILVRCSAHLLCRAHQLAWNSSCVSANLLALPDPYGYTPTNTVTAVGGLFLSVRNVNLSLSLMRGWKCRAAQVGRGPRGSPAQPPLRRSAVRWGGFNDAAWR